MNDDRRDPGDRLEELLAEHRDPPQETEADDAEPLDPFEPAATTAGNVPDEAEDTLPDAPLFALLRTIETEVGTDRIDRIWIFPLRRLEAGETAVVVIAAFIHDDPDRRRVYAAHYTAHQDASETRLALDEFGTAPTDRVGRMVEEVVERVKDGPAGAPRSHTIDGRQDRWNEVLHQLADAHLAAARKNPRLRP